MAAAVVVAIRNSLASRSAGEDKNDEASARQENMNNLDTNNDGRLSLHELQAHVKRADVKVRADIVLQRLRLENGLTDMAIKLPNFLLCLTCFLLAMLELSPPQYQSSIHKHLEDHFFLRSIKDIKDTHSIYEYMEQFETQNMKMNPTSAKYWCEHRYSNYHWDDHTGVPVMDCNSPRLGALGIGTTKWSQVHSASSAAESHHRRLAGSSSGASGKATHPIPPCIDDDARLRIEEANPNVTCKIAASHVCDIDLGIRFCPKTCGFCSPFEYDHVKRFDKPQVTMLPTVVFQTRFAAAPCHGFAHDFELQNYNPVLTSLPALDGHRNGRILSCVDRSKILDDAYALELDCPPNVPPTKCVDGKVHVTPKHTFHGLPIYPKLLVEPHRDLHAMEQIEWLDVQTDTVSLSTMVYTEDLEIFTSLTVTFTLDVAGNVEGDIKMFSYRDLIGDSKTWFSTCLIITCCGAFLGVVLITHKLVRQPEECDWCLVLYEIISRALLLGYPLVLLISWTQQVPMAHEYQLILNTILDSDGMDEANQNKTMADYFAVKDHIYHEVSWLENHRTAAYLVCYVQFLQLIFYFNAHPAMAMLTSTVHKAMSSMLHFFLVFSVLFVMLAFMAHWLLGGMLHDFATFSDAMAAQARMLYGAFIVADGVEYLSGNLSVMYWVYALTFLLLAVFTLLNFFLAITVDAFVAVRADNEKLEAVGTFFSDVMSLPHAFYFRVRLGLPSSKKLTAFFNDVCDKYKQDHIAEHMHKGVHRMSVCGNPREEECPFCSPTEILKRFGNDGLTSDSLCEWLLYMQGRTKELTIYFDDEKDEEANMETVNYPAADSDEADDSKRDALQTTEFPVANQSDNDVMQCHV